MNQILSSNLPVDLCILSDTYLRFDGLLVLRLVAQIAGDMCAAHILLNIWQSYCESRDLQQVTTETCSPRGCSGSGSGSTFIELNNVRNHKQSDKRGRASFLEGNGNTSATLNNRGTSGQHTLPPFNSVAAARGVEPRR